MTPWFQPAIPNDVKPYMDQAEEAVSAAKQFITRAIETNPGLGHGFGPVNHFTPT